MKQSFDLKFGNHGYITKAFSCFHFKEEGVVQMLIHELKYQNKKTIGILLGEIVGNAIKHDIDFTSTDALLPVPLHKIRLRERGYNQSELIAKGISKVTGVKVINDMLIRKRNTQTQTKLNFEQRLENVKDAFVLNEKYKNFVVGKRFAIVDDVITTGGTKIEALAKLSAAAKVNISGLVVAVDRQEKGKMKSAISEFEDASGIKVASIEKISNVFEYLRNRDVDGKIYVTEENYEAFRAYQKQYGVAYE
ncbi:MAG: hypothetical protein ACK4NX_01500 [Candidatus Paceibacteria bacterium]